MALDEFAWRDAVRGTVILQALWSDKRDRVAAALPPGWQISLYQFSTSTWLPSYVTAKNPDRPGEYRVWINGTANTAQAVIDASAYWATPWNDGFAHTGFAFSATWLQEQLLGDVIDGDGATDVRIFGHSYGGALAQGLAYYWCVPVNGSEPVFDPAVVRVATIGSPKIFTTGVIAPSWPVDLIMGDGDPVPQVPGDWLPILRKEPLLFNAPVPVSQNWYFAGSQHWIDTDGTETATNPVAVGPVTSVPTLGLEPHFYAAYLAKLKALGELRRFAVTPEIQGLYDLFGGIPIWATPTNQLSPDVYHSGITPPVPEWAVGGGGIHSNGSYGMASTAPIMCKVWWACSGYSWSEGYIFQKTAGDGGTLAEAKAKFLQLLEQRAKLFVPNVLYGVHYNATKIRVARIGNDREADNTDEEGIDIPQPAGTAAAGKTEWPFVRLMQRFDAGTLARRKVWFGPCPDGSFQDNTGKVATRATMFASANTYGSVVISMGCWYIKYKDKAVTKRPAVSAVGGPPNVGNQVLLNVPGHGLIAGDHVDVVGGDKQFKPLRGNYLIQYIDANSFYVTTRDTFVYTGPCNVDTRKVVYQFGLINAQKNIGVRSRQTARPIDGERGASRRRSRA